MAYSEFLSVLEPYRDGQFAAFQKKIIRPPKADFLGVRTPDMRKIAKKLQADLSDIFSFPDEYYETTFIKLTIVSLLPYEKFVLWTEKCLPLIDNWALCDCFKADCIKKNREDFLSRMEGYFARGGEYDERFVLVTLLSFYAEEKYLPAIKDFLSRADTTRYYVHMAAAWLTAEILVKCYDKGVELLESGILAPATHDKAIQKARESYRLTPEQKGFLNSLKIKTR